MTEEDLTVTYKDNSVRLNHNLIVQKALSKMQVEAIKDLHLQRMMIEGQLADVHREEDIKHLFSQWTFNQFSLQRAWGFPEDANWHPSHRLSKCSCEATMDNDERLGTPYRVVTQGCPIHDPA